MLDRMEGEDPETARSLPSRHSQDPVRQWSECHNHAGRGLPIPRRAAWRACFCSQVSDSGTDAREWTPTKAAPSLTRGFARTDLRITPEARTRIIQLSEGLPHFVHLIALHAGELAVQNDDQEVSLRDVNDSLANAVRAHSLAVEYDEATRSPQKANLYERALWPVPTRLGIRSDTLGPLVSSRLSR